MTGNTDKNTNIYNPHKTILTIHYIRYICKIMEQTQK